MEGFAIVAMVSKVWESLPLAKSSKPDNQAVIKTEIELNMQHEIKLNQSSSCSTKYTLCELLSKLTLKGYQIKLLAGLQDTLNGYGWHTRYYIEVIECVEFCSKCREKWNVNYNDNDYGLHHQHSHKQEYKTIFAKEFISETDMIQGLMTIL